MVYEVDPEFKLFFDEIHDNIIKKYSVKTFLISPENYIASTKVDSETSKQFLTTYNEKQSRIYFGEEKYFLIKESTLENDPFPILVYLHKNEEDKDKNLSILLKKVDEDTIVVHQCSEMEMKNVLTYMAAFYVVEQ